LDIWVLGLGFASGEKGGDINERTVGCFFTGGVELGVERIPKRKRQVKVRVLAYATRCLLLLRVALALVTHNLPSADSYVQLHLLIELLID